MLDSLVRVSRRDGEIHLDRLSQHHRKRTGCTAQPNIPATPTKPDGCSHSAPPTSGLRRYRLQVTSSLRFPDRRFRYSLTLFSKFFASFPHGTCALSVSHQYLALEGIYLPIRAAIPNNSTQLYAFRSPTVRETHPLTCHFPAAFGRIYCTRTPQFGPKADSHLELFPLQSPLLRESLLVSFPPLIYMLKFSG